MWRHTVRYCFKYQQEEEEEGGKKRKKKGRSLSKKKEEKKGESLALGLGHVLVCDNEGTWPSLSFTPLMGSHVYLAVLLALYPDRIVELSARLLQRVMKSSSKDRLLTVTLCISMRTEAVGLGLGAVWPDMIGSTLVLGLVSIHPT